MKMCSITKVYVLFCSSKPTSVSASLKCITLIYNLTIFKRVWKETQQNALKYCKNHVAMKIINQLPTDCKDCNMWSDKLNNILHKYL